MNELEVRSIPGINDEPVDVPSELIEGLSDKQLLVAKYVGLGRSQRECAVILRADPNEIRRCANHPRVKALIDYYRELRDEAIMNSVAQFTSLIPMAVERHKQLLSGEETSEPVLMRAITEVYDRIQSGHFVKANRTEHVHHHVVDSSMVSAMKEQGKKLGMGKIIDVTFEEGGDPSGESHEAGEEAEDGQDRQVDEDTGSLG